MQEDDLSYITPHTIMGMCSKQYKVLENGFQKNKNNITLFYPFTEEQILSLPQDKVSISYLLQGEYDYFKSLKIEHTKSKSTLILSKIDEEFLQLKGDKWHEFRECRNKYNKIATIKTEPNSIDE